jgi:hypothetical protein
MTILVFVWLFFAFPPFSTEVEVGGRVPADLGTIGSQNFLLSATAVASIYLHVIEAGTGSPVPAAVLWLEGQPECYTTSNESGNTRLDLPLPLSADQISLRVRAPLHAEGSLVLNPTRREETILLRWAPAYLSGQVLDGGGQAVRGAAVRIGHRRDATFTDDYGRFIVPGFTIGERAHVGIAHEGFRPLTHTLEARTSDRSLPLPILTIWGPRDVKGRVVDEMGRPLAGVSVAAGGTEVGITGPNGTFLAPSVVDDPATLEFVRQDLASVALRVELKEGETTLDVGNVVLQPGLRLWGRVTDVDGDPIPEAEVVLEDRIKTATHARHRGQVVHSDRNGEFIADGLPAEVDVEVEIRAAGYVPARAQISLAGDEERTFVLRPASRLLGRILDSQEEPLEGAQITLRSSRSEGLPSYSLNLRSDADGRFVAEDMPPGTAKLGVWAPGFAWHDESVVTEGADVELDVHLVAEAAVIGRLTDDAGKGIKGAVVRVLGEKTRPGLGDTADAAGSFYLFGLRPGPLELEVSSTNIRRRFKTLVTPGEQHLEIRLGETESLSLEGRALLGRDPLAGIESSSG